MKPLLFFAFTTFALAQSTLTLSGPNVVKPGQTIELNLSLTGTSQPVGIQTNLVSPTGFTQTQVSSLVSDKTLYQSEPKLTNLLVGMNVTSLPAGNLAKFTYSVSSATAKGTYPFQLSEVVASNADGELVTVSLGPTYSVRVISKADLNGDGVVNGTDFNLMVDQVIRRSACADDQNGDGKCNVIDVILVFRETLVPLVP